MTENWRLLEGDVIEQLATLPRESIQCVVTSPPYWGLRDYKVVGQMGLEATIEEWVEKMVAVFREVRRVLREDGTVWLNLGDCHACSKRGGSAGSGTMQAHRRGTLRGPVSTPKGLKVKDLIGMPWLAAFALRADGWWLRSDIIWSKPNSMPESVTDRPTRAHEYLFLLTKAERYYYDAAAIRERAKHPNHHQIVDGKQTKRVSSHKGEARHAMPGGDKQCGHSRRHDGFNDRWDAMEKGEQQANGANKRTVWEIATQPYAEAHFATFPGDLVKPCVLAGTHQDDLVLDPFSGSATTGVVALGLGRRYVGIELNPEYNEMARKRLTATSFQTVLA